MQAILYKQDNGKIAVMSPAPSVFEEYTVMEVAIKDVPAGKPFAIVNISDLPQDLPQDAWVIDDADLDSGVGGESNEFNA